MAFPEGQDDNVSQHMGSTVHDDDFQEAINMISDDIEKQKEARYDNVPVSHTMCYTANNPQTESGRVKMN